MTCSNKTQNHYKKDHYLIHLHQDFHYPEIKYEHQLYEQRYHQSRSFLVYHIYGWNLKALKEDKPFSNSLFKNKTHISKIPGCREYEYTTIYETRSKRSFLIPQRSNTQGVINYAEDMFKFNHPCSVIMVIAGEYVYYDLLNFDFCYEYDRGFNMSKYNQIGGPCSVDDDLISRVNCSVEELSCEKPIVTVDMTAAEPIKPTQEKSKKTLDYTDFQTIAEKIKDIAIYCKENNKIITTSSHNINLDGIISDWDNKTGIFVDYQETSNQPTETISANEVISLVFGSVISSLFSTAINSNKQLSKAKKQIKEDIKQEENNNIEQEEIKNVSR